MTDGFDRDGARAAILAAALAHAPFDGWTDAVLAQAAREAGYAPETALRVFPGGPAEAIVFWSQAADRAMIAALDTPDFAGLRTREKIARAIRARLEAATPHKEALRRALGFLALPLNAHRAPGLAWRTVDAIWYAAGDRATDFNFYTKRGLLLGVYSATVLYWLDDRSDGHEASWRFLDRRIADVMAVPKALADLGARVRGFAPPFMRGFGAGRR
jgi:ubiquinone biosynthesis protein COQ9